MTRFDAESCAELGDLCEFDPMPQLAYWDGGPECTTIEKPGYGWCFPRINGGAGSPEVYWNPQTGEITALSFMSANIPPGWEVCVPGPDRPPCCCGPAYGVLELPSCSTGPTTGGTGGSGDGTSTGTSTGG
ncbi:MAG: hypothetical protein D6705_18255 [Deltaproteobacteria bacterium]|nr:MAG: hypothetical protein D6705_18255 [Deltaproteobacteria bacterium]